MNASMDSQQKQKLRKIIFIIMLAFFAPFAIWSIATKRLTLFFGVAVGIYFLQQGINRWWPKQPTSVIPSKKPLENTKNTNNSKQKKKKQTKKPSKKRLKKKNK